MALNQFKTRAAVLTETSETIYTAPTGFTSVVIMAQIANTTSTAVSATVVHRDTGGVETQLIQDFNIPGNDSASVLTGKLVLETGQSIKASKGASGSAKIILSILDTSNG